MVETKHQTNERLNFRTKNIAERKQKQKKTKITDFKHLAHNFLLLSSQAGNHKVRQILFRFLLKLLLFFQFYETELDGKLQEKK